MGLVLNRSNLKGFIDPKDMENIVPLVQKAHKDLHNKTGKGSDYVGWVNLPSSIKPAFIDELEDLGKKVQENSDCVISIGIGGSYLGIRASIEFLRDAAKIPVYYVGQNICPDYLASILDQVKDKRVTVVVISKSGTTTEPAVAFRIVKKFMLEKYGNEQLKDRIICVTDEKKGALRKIADKSGYRAFVIPDDVGGRFSILTPVGLVPLAVAGVDVRKFVAGAQAGEKEYSVKDFEKNAAYQYAAARFILSQQGKVIEVLSSFYDNMAFVCEWWKQLFGESEGKDGKGIFPASMIFSTDLHSMGQLMQDGMRNIFETFVMIEKSKRSILIPEDAENLDDFNFVAGKELDFVNKKAYQATSAAHFEGGVPNMTITIDTADAYHLGLLYYFFEKAVGISGYLSGVNPFDQPGVEAYKKKMFTLLGRK
ncbi:MAG: glucose-6-phosphate isomerase [Candidatus Omnitrophica bacterium]|nr:glucose-6-phosphate isomerase [Candidatus Omnitrophota bacterium]